jgi:hypothetical protein
MQNDKKNMFFEWLIRGGKYEIIKHSTFHRIELHISASDPNDFYNCYNILRHAVPSNEKIDDTALKG